MQDAIENCKHRRTCIKKICKKKNIAKEHMHTPNNNFKKKQRKKTCCGIRGGGDNER